MATPTPLRLKFQLALDRERERMLNEWFFRWHFIGQNGPIEIDGFDGRVIKYGGIKFYGSPRDVYWNTLKRYLQNKVAEYFDDAEQKVLDYPFEMQSKIFTEVASELRRFTSQIIFDAIDKDRILRGDGMNFPSKDSSYADRFLIEEMISARETSLIETVLARKPKEKTRFERISSILKEHKEIIAISGTGLIFVYELLKSLVLKLIPFLKL